MPEQSLDPRYDVVILGAGIAGLTLARQLLLYSDKRVLLLEKRSHIPPARQKVGESNVQVQGYYLSKILDMEEYLLREHFMKYNLRFYWKTPGLKNDCYEEISQCYIRNFSNIACYQLDRNKIEGELLRLNHDNPRFSFVPGISSLDVALADSSTPHTLSFNAGEQLIKIQADWVVDTTGRSRFLARRGDFIKTNPIRHGSVFFWIDGLLNIEKLSPLSHSQRLLHQNRRMLGHLPTWLATNHFCGEGYWFWVIPLQGRTSFGLVYDRQQVPEDLLTSPENVVDWICKEYPLFAAYLAKEKIADRGMIRDFSYDCQQTISAEKWALAGESGRFTDPLYSPGGDLIALYNTLIIDAIQTEDVRALSIKARLYEVLMCAFYQAYVPSYAVGYAVLGDQECFAMKYAWELTIYFTFYVFPFINSLFTQTEFVVPYLDLFAQLGAWNRNIQEFLCGYYHWKKNQPHESSRPVLFDLTGFEPLKRSEELFYEVGVAPCQAISLLKNHMANIEKLGRFIAIYIYSVVTQDEKLLRCKQLIETLRIDELSFDPERIRQECRNLDRGADEEFGKIGQTFIMHFGQRHNDSLTQLSKRDATAPLSAIVETPSFLTPTIPVHPKSYDTLVPATTASTFEKGT
jgi:2-polyprenyl-6-methoxyphenol hydroxylase-like FAD-dependent oxidoreductase